MVAPDNTEKLEYRGWTLRVRSTQARPDRRLLLVHGLTGDENSMWVFTRRLPPDYWIVAPRARHSAGTSGYSWRARTPHDTTRPESADFREAVEDLFPILEAFCAERDLADAAWNVMGFSQGAAVAATLAMLFPAHVDRIALLAGFVPPNLDQIARSVPLRGKSAFVAHGVLDELVDVELGRRAVGVLRAAGASVQVCEDHVGHKVSAGCLRTLELFFR